MNGRETLLNTFGVKLETINGKEYAIPYISIKLPNNAGTLPASLEVKFRKYKVCDNEGNIKEAWLLGTEPFNLP
jgi:hypothetical protein